MLLSKQTIEQLGISNSLSTGEKSAKETVIQFGTGVLLRGLPDYFIDKANKQNIFNGKIVLIKSTDNGSADEFALQNNLFTHCIKGVLNGKMMEECIINTSISRVLSAKKDWDTIIQCASNPDMQIVISNTTEVGIILIEDNLFTNQPPISFPGKLLAFLLARYNTFKGSDDAGMVIIPTELITDNGSMLMHIVLELAKQNKLDEAFINWLITTNDFCNSLVDRIVPGRMPTEQHEAMQRKLGYEDELMIMSEVYSLWAIETVNQRSIDILSFSKIDDGVVISSNINKYRELKLRLLNGTHTFSCGLAYLAGFDTVKDAMSNKIFNDFLFTLMIEEIVPSIVSEEISKEQAYSFANNVIDRFRNPDIDHRWLSITLNYTSKMKMRNIPLIVKYYHHNRYVPKYMAMGFAAYILFMKVYKEENGKYYGNRNTIDYLIQDEFANYYFKLWQQENIDILVNTILCNTDLWDTDLSLLTGFEKAVIGYLAAFMQGDFFKLISLQGENLKYTEVYA